MVCWILWRANIVARDALSAAEAMADGNSIPQDVSFACSAALEIFSARKAARSSWLVGAPPSVGSTAFCAAFDASAITASRSKSPSIPKSLEALDSSFSGGSSISISAVPSFVKLSILSLKYEFRLSKKAS